MSETQNIIPRGTLEAERGLFRFATAGSVDDGKSTLVGRLLHDSKSILVDQLEAVARTSAERGFGGDEGGLDLALLTDGLRAEREQGITIDVAYRYFSTALRSFILADCPGHVQYTRNMVTGAATADAVIVLIDARYGLLEQTRRHLSVVQLLRVPNVIVAVNKIDLVDYSREVFDDILGQLERVTRDLNLSGVHAIPVSALVGDNVVERSAHTDWYQGPTLLELLESLPAIDELQRDDDPFRLPVQYVLRPQGALAPSAADRADELRDYRGYLGQIASGSVSVGDTVELYPGGFKTTVSGISIADRSVQTAFAPQSVALELADQFDLARGAVIAAEGTLAEPTNNLSGELFWLDPRPLVAGQRLLLKTGTVTTQVIVSAIEGRRNLETLAIDPADKLEINDIGHASLRLATPVPIDDYAQNRRAGAFLLIHPQDGATLAAGIHTAQNTYAI
ncbi:MAG: sulfate adenylyltransferase subunit 1 [Micrococcales bacterium]